MDELTRLTEERPVRILTRREAPLVTALGVALSALALYWAVGVIEPLIYRLTFLLLALVLTFILYPAERGARTASVMDWVLVAGAIAALLWPIIDIAEFPYRAATPTGIDIALGALLIVLVLEATRRTVGPILPITALIFLLYSYLGPLLDLVGLSLFAHRGYYPERLVGSLYMTLEGIFGTPLDVASTYIILFTIFGAALERSGAGRFFIDWALAATGRSASGAGPGRAVTAAGFLLGTVSGSGVATTVTLGSVSWPLLRRAGYPRTVAGAVLAAAGIGAILSPPTLGAAAFLIAEFLRISYLQVLVMAVIPTLLYYLSAWLMIEADSRRLGARAVQPETGDLWELTRRYWYHFVPLVAVVVLMSIGMSAFRAVLWATAMTIAMSFVRPESALRPRRLVEALEAGGRGVLAVAATTATAGIIVGVVTLTGLGLKIAGIIVSLAGGQLVPTVVYAAIAVWVLGLAVPVTASYIIAAVMIAPALTQVGIPAPAAHMFIFYYAVLSEVSPPTALAPFAAAAITGANPFRTMMLTWRYTLPAFLVPFVFTLTNEGRGILLQGSVENVLTSSVSAAVGVAALAWGLGGWLRGRSGLIERALAIGAGLSLMYASRTADLIGGSLLLAAIGAMVVRAGYLSRRAPA